jgi:hypothetical protein
VADEEKSLEDIFEEMQRGRASRVNVDHREKGRTTITERIVEVDADGKPTAKIVKTTSEKELHNETGVPE